MQSNYIWYHRSRYLLSDSHIHKGAAKKRQNCTMVRTTVPQISRTIMHKPRNETGPLYKKHKYREHIYLCYTSITDTWFSSRVYYHVMQPFYLPHIDISFNLNRPIPHLMLPKSTHISWIHTTIGSKQHWKSTVSTAMLLQSHSMDPVRNDLRD
jgi:hypothetical protein